METDVEVEEVIEKEESKFETDEEVEEILEEEKDDEDGENFNSFPTMEELTHHEWLLKNPRPLWSAQKPPGGLAVGADELSPTSYLGLKAKHNLFRGGKQTSTLSAPWSAEVTSKDGDEVDSGMGKSGGVPDGGVSAMVWESMICGGGE
ncbi:hypothetical protein Tco_1389445 [Tanacetum coccineum]